MRKKLSETKREIVIGRDKSKCCRGELRQRRSWPFRVCCDECNKDVVYEDDIIFHKINKTEELIRKLVSKSPKEKRDAVLNEYDRIILEKSVSHK